MPTRRSLLKFAAGWTAGSYARIAGANRRVRLGLIGCGGRGLYDTGFMQQLPDVELAATCDVWLSRAAQARAQLSAMGVKHTAHRGILPRTKTAPARA